MDMGWVVEGVCVRGVRDVGVLRAGLGPKKKIHPGILSLKLVPHTYKLLSCYILLNSVHIDDGPMGCPSKLWAGKKTKETIFASRE